MTGFSNAHTFTAAAAFGAAALFSMLSSGGTAEAASLFKCEGTTAKSVVSCCHEMTRDRRPMWMVRSGKNCEQVTVCRAKKSSATYSTASVAAPAPAPLCFIKVALENPNDGRTPGNDNGSRKRDGGGRQSGAGSNPN